MLENLKYIVVDLLSNFDLRLIWLNIFNSKLNLLLALIPCLLLLLILEAKHFGWNNSALKRLMNPSKSAQLDIALVILYASSLISILTILFSFGLSELIPIKVRKLFGFGLINSIDNIYIQYAVYIIIYDFLFYWKHRLSHTISWWWQLHKLHHSAEELNLITADRLHPLDEVITRLFMCLPLAIAGIPLVDFLILTVLHRSHRMLIHSMLPWDFGWLGKYILISPIAHRIHHSKLPEHTNKNFSNSTPLWDKLFGTWYEGNIINTSVGVEQNTHNNKLWFVDIWDSYLDFWKYLWKDIRILIFRKSTVVDSSTSIIILFLTYLAITI
ncbi:MAG: sterol desaturase family protein [Candidatus Melainabacteria bacterium]|nr:sterol desaturase family protein [Candidatus Melainabacteria bacterium]MBI3308679.1 sterol desaturase family protein [Candidatus Melainabacteria bacterium]